MDGRTTRRKDGRTGDTNKESDRSEIDSECRIPDVILLTFWSSFHERASKTIPRVGVSNWLGKISTRLEYLKNEDTLGMRRGEE